MIESDVMRRYESSSGGVTAIVGLPEVGVAMEVGAGAGDAFPAVGTAAAGDVAQPATTSAMATTRIRISGFMLLLA